MKDNYANQEDEGIGAFFEQRREEFRTQKRTQKIMVSVASISFVAGVALIGSFDVRLGFGVFFICQAFYLGFRFL